MRKTKRNDALMKAIIQVGMCYRMDMITYINYLCKSTNGNINLSEREKDGMISNIDVLKAAPEFKGDSYRVITLSQYGRMQATALYGKQSQKYIKAAIGHYQHDIDKMRRRLLSVRATLAFEAVGIPAFPAHKPKLSNLNIAMRNRNNLSAAAMEKTELYKDMSAEECIELIQTTGVYYTVAEVREFIGESETGDTDAVQGARPRGIFISDHDVYMVYVGKRGKNQNIKVKYNVEHRFYTAIKELVISTNVHRLVPEMAKNEINMAGEKVKGKPAVNDIGAIVLSDGNKMAMSLSKTDIFPADWLAGENDLYSKVFVTPYNNEGLDALKYVCSHSLEKWHQESIELFQKNPDLNITDDNPYFPANEVGQDAATLIYMPVYEMKTLLEIKKSKNLIGVMTHDYMRDTISKIVGHEVIFYNCDNTQIFENEAMVYASKGIPAGAEMLIARAEAEQRSITPTQIRKLPAAFGYDSAIKFYNDIYYGDLSADEVYSKITTNDKLTKKRIHHATVTIGMTKQKKDKLKKAAKLYGMTLQGYVASLIDKQVEADAAKYDAQLKHDRDVVKGKV